MLTFCIKTVRLSLTVVFLVASFSINVYSFDSTLCYLEKNLNRLVFDISSSIVTVEASWSQTQSNNRFDDIYVLPGLISSGIVVDSNGHILVTIPAVENRDKILVNFGSKSVPAKIVGADYQSGLALLSTGVKLGQPVIMSEQYLCTGQMVVAIGNAFGIRANPTLGFCAGTRPDGNIQFSGLISSGTTGGGLFDLTGNLVGLISGSLGDDDKAGVGLAVPAYKLSGVVQYIKKYGNKPAGYIGVNSTEIEIVPPIVISRRSSNLSFASQNRIEISKGFVINFLFKDSPASRAGLRENDLIFEVDGRLVNSIAALRERIIMTAPGTVISFGFIRNNQVYYTQVIAGETKQWFSKNIPPKRGLSKNARLFDSLSTEINDLKNKLDELEKLVKISRGN